MNENLNAGFNVDDERRRRYREMLDVYRGRQWPGRAAGERRLTFNYAAAAVDKLSAYLMNGLAVRVAENTPAGQQAQNLLNRWSAANCLDRLDYETEVDTAVLGDGCYRLGWDEVTRSVRVTAPDVCGLEVAFGLDGVTPEMVRAGYRLSAEAAARAWGIKVASAEVEVTESWTASHFEVSSGGLTAAAGDNPYGFIPFIVFPNLSRPKSPWGTSDLEPLMEAQRELNRAVSQLSRILELSGNPIAVLENVESSSYIAVSPGAVWHLPEEARAYLLDLLQGGGGQLHLNYIDLLFRVMHDLGEVPRAAFGGLGRDVSGVALELEMQPLLHRVWRKRLIRTGVYRRRAEMALKLYARHLDLELDEVTVEVNWPPVLPRDITAMVANEKTLVAAGLRSRKGAMTGLGIPDPEQEFADWLEEEKAIKKQESQS
ncbi:MAG: phage portal protein [Dehalogenimonas sp.]|uniref:Phage portal protein n=1 Tax=Candidatus Dehalogenimonas loeffleri TaxID=3127115 RepID=A0ABZ2J1C5_9CHLR|nr:phage portal protein [Dehalogenimonas sp.]